MCFLKFIISKSLGPVWNIEGFENLCLHISHTSSIIILVDGRVSTGPSQTAPIKASYNSDYLKEP